MGNEPNEILTGSPKYGNAILIRADNRGNWYKIEVILSSTNGEGVRFAIGSGKLDQDKW